VKLLFLLIVIKCVDPGEVVNATYTITGQYPGDTASYACNVLSTQKGGDSVRTCTHFRVCVMLIIEEYIVAM
jgi:hypothetical protein